MHTLFLIGGGTGSPLAARQDGSFFLPVLLALIVIAVACSVALILRIIKAKHQSPEWIAAQKAKPTTLQMLNKTAKEFGLSTEEKNILWESCKSVNAPNIFYLIRDSEAVDDLLRRQYATMKGQKRSVQTVYALFTLRFKLEAGSADATSINSTYKLKEGQILTLYKNEEVKYPMKIAAVEKPGIYLELHPACTAPENRPREMSRVRFSLLTKPGCAFSFVTRIMRYTTRREKQMVLIAHSNSVASQERRKDKRIELEKDCTISAVKVAAQTSQSKTELHYETVEKQYPAQFKDISAGGCRLVTKLPIKEGQYIHLYFDLHGEHCDAVGIILHTQKNKDESAYMLRIRFVKLDPGMRNTIMATVYNY